jgi:predicted small secreted protein
MMKKSLVLAGSLLVACALLLGACAEQDSGQGAASGGSPTTVAPTTSAPPPTTSEMPRDQVKVRATGTVQQGVEPGCLILDTGKGQRYVLLSQDTSKLKPGAKVEVVGVRATGQISYCQQGQPLEVLTVRAAS